MEKLKTNKQNTKNIKVLSIGIHIKQILPKTANIINNKMDIAFEFI